MPNVTISPPLPPPLATPTPSTQVILSTVSIKNARQSSHAPFPTVLPMMELYWHDAMPTSTIYSPPERYAFFCLKPTNLPSAVRSASSLLQLGCVYFDGMRPGPSGSHIRRPCHRLLPPIPGHLHALVGSLVLMTSHPRQCCDSALNIVCVFFFCSGSYPAPSHCCN